MKIVYGIAVQESDDPYISMAEEALGGVAEAGIPGAFWVDMFPILKYVPSWFPGAGFQKKAARWREGVNAMAENPFRHVQEQLVRVQILRAQESLSTMIICRKMATLRRPWQQALLRVFLMRTILNAPRKRGLRKKWLG